MNKALAVHYKKGGPVDMVKPISQYISTFYASRMNINMLDIEDDLQKIQNLRNEVSSANGTLDATKDTIVRYYYALCALETRIPISKDQGNVSIGFQWFDAFRNSRLCTQHNIHFEKSAVMFNLGAILSQQGLQEDKGSSEALGEAARRFEEAAFAFTSIKDHVGLKLEPSNTRDFAQDLSQECCQLLINLHLAQAQEYVFEKLRLEGRKPLLLSRISKQTSILYQNALKQVQNPQLSQGQYFEKSWQSHFSAKSTYFEIQALVLKSADELENEEYGNEVSRLRAGLALSEKLRKDLKSTFPEMYEALTKEEEQLRAKLKKSEQMNSSVYYKLVKNNEDLAPITGTPPLVKPREPQVLAGQNGADWLTNLITESALQQESIYTTRRDQLLRTCFDQLNQATDDTRLKLRQWELPEILNSVQGAQNKASQIPEYIRSKVLGIETNGGVAHLEGLSQTIRDIRSSDETDLNNIEKDLDAERAEDTQLRGKYNNRWTREPSMKLTSHYQEKIAIFKQNLKVARESDDVVYKNLQVFKSQFASLDLDTLGRTIPPMESPMISVDNLEPATVVATIKGCLNELEMLSSERGQLEGGLKETKQQDNILPKLMNQASQSDQMFQQELGKYNDLKSKVEENVSRTQNVLNVLNHNQKGFRELYDVGNWSSRMNEWSQSTNQKLSKYDEIITHLDEAVKFYTNLQDAINSIGKQVKDFVFSRNLEKEERIRQIESSNYNMSQSHSNFSSSQYPSPQPQSVPSYPQQQASQYQQRPAQQASPMQSQASHPIQQQQGSSKPGNSFLNSFRRQSQEPQQFAQQQQGQFVQQQPQQTQQLQPQQYPVPSYYPTSYPQHNSAPMDSLSSNFQGSMNLNSYPNPHQPSGPAAQYQQYQQYPQQSQAQAQQQSSFQQQPNQQFQNQQYQNQQYQQNHQQPPPQQQPQSQQQIQGQGSVPQGQNQYFQQQPQKQGGVFNKFMQPFQR